MTQYQMQSFQNNPIQKQHLSINQKNQKFSNFHELKKRLQSQISLFPQDIDPLKYKIGQQLQQCNVLVSQLSNIHDTVINEGTKEFKSHLNQILTYQGDKLQDNDKFDLENYREQIKEGLLEMSDLMYVQLNKGLWLEQQLKELQFKVICEGKMCQFRLDIRQMNESQLVYKCTLPMKAFIVEQKNVSAIRQHYFDQIILSKTVYEKYINEQQGSQFFSTVQQVQHVILKLHNIIVDDLKDVSNNIDYNRFFIQLMNRESQKYLLHFQRQQIKVSSDSQMEELNEYKKQFQKVNPKHSQFDKIQRMKVNYIQNIQDTKEGYDQLLQIDDQINSIINEYDEMNQLTDQLNMFMNSIKQEIHNHISQFTKSFQQTLTSQQQANIQQDIQNLLQELNHNLNDEQPVEEPQHSSSNPFLKNAHTFKSDYHLVDPQKLLFNQDHIITTPYKQSQRLEKEKEWQNQRLQEIKQQGELNLQKKQQRYDQLQQMRMQRQQELDNHINSIRYPNTKNVDVQQLENQNQQLIQSGQDYKQRIEEQQTQREEQIRVNKLKQDQLRQQQEQERKLRFQQQDEIKQKQELEKQQKLKQQQQQQQLQQQQLQEKQLQQQQQRQQQLQQQQLQQQQQKQELNKVQEIEKIKKLRDKQQQDESIKFDKKINEIKLFRQNKQQNYVANINKEQLNQASKFEKHLIEIKQYRQKQQQTLQLNINQKQLQQAQIFDNYIEDIKLHKIQKQKETEGLKKESQLNQAQKFEKYLLEIKQFRLDQQQNSTQKLNKAQQHESQKFESYINNIKEHRKNQEQLYHQQLQDQKQNNINRITQQQQNESQKFYQYIQYIKDHREQLHMQQMKEQEQLHMQQMKEQEQLLQQQKQQQQQQQKNQQLKEIGVKQEKQSIIFAQRLNDISNYRKDMKLKGINQDQIQQSQIFEQKLNDIIKYRKNQEDQDKKQLQELEKQRNQEELKRQKEQQDKLEAIKLKKMNIDQNQIDQSKIFEQKLIIIQKYRDDQHKEYLNQQQLQQQQQLLQNQQKIEQRNKFQTQQSIKFEQYLHQIHEHREDMKIDEEQDRLRELKKQQNNEDSDPELEYPDEDIEFEDDYSLSPKKVDKKQTKFEESEDYLKNSKQLYQGESEEDEEGHHQQIHQQQMEDEEDGVAQPLIQFQDILTISELIKQCVGNQGQPNFDEFNNFECLVDLMSEYLSHKAIFFDFDHGEMLLELTNNYLEECEKMSQEEALEQIHEQMSNFHGILHKMYIEQIQQNTDAFHSFYTYFMPFPATEIGITLIMICPQIQKMYFFVDTADVQYEFLQNLQLLTQYVFQCEIPGKDPEEMLEYEVSIQDMSKNDIYLQQKEYIQYMTIPFGIVYELDLMQFEQEQKCLQINIELLRRLFHVLLARDQVLKMLKDEEFFNHYQYEFLGYVQHAEQEQNHVVLQHVIPLDAQDLEQQVLQQVGSLMERSQHLDSGFLLLEFEQDQQKMAYYLNAIKIGEDKYELAIYINEMNDEQLNQSIAETIYNCQQQYPEYQIRCFQDFPRQNQIYDHGAIVLGIWLKLVDQCGLDPHQAFQFVSYSLIPTQMFLSDQEEN